MSSSNTVLSSVNIISVPCGHGITTSYHGMLLYDSSYI